MPGTDLPLRAVLPELLATLAARDVAVLVAPPGTGKTTLVPLALAGLLDALPEALPYGAAGAGRAGRVLVAEPRRLAARAAARRMSDLVGDRVGGLVGFTVRGESRTSAATRVEVVTTGLLVQRLLADPELPGVDVVVLDECHERHLDTDLALAFCLDVRATIRPDLKLLATSATADSARLATALGTTPGTDPGTDPGDAPVVDAAGVLHPVDPVWCPPPPGIPPPFGLRVDPRLLDHVAAVARRALAERDGDLLVFLPGAGEIGRLAGLLGGAADPHGRPLDVVPLHGRLPGDVQDAALRPAPGRRRVVLATSVAESSVTVPGVRVVVDAGLARVPRTDLGRGLDALVTVRVSRAAAVQRAGRAGREAPGSVYRCWSAAEHDRLPARPEPEVATADLTGFALRLACWGSPGGRGLTLLDAPAASALEVATGTLHDLGAVDDDGRATARGRALARVGAHPRLARALLDGAAAVGPQRAAELVAILSEDGPSSGGDDLTARWRSLASGRDPGSARWREETRRLLRSLPDASAVPRSPGAAGSSGPAAPGALPSDLAAGTVVGLAFPERLARRRRPGGRSYLMASGTAAELPEGTGLSAAEWLAIAVADRPPGRRDARVRAAVPVDEATAREVGGHLLAVADEVTWSDGDVRSRRVERLGAIVLAERAVPADPELAAAAVATGLRQEGLDLLRWTEGARALRRRLAACRAGLGDPWPAVDDDSLLAHLDLGAARCRADLLRLDVATALRALAGWQLAGTLDQVAPERVEVPSGSRVAVDYSDPEAPALPVKVQEVFGWTSVPRVAGRPVLLRLLSPAGRPVATTTDLDSFWRTGYPAVRAELRGRYPRHPWPEDPLAAAPTRRANPRRP